jgi:hypothetical protein
MTRVLSFSFFFKNTGTHELPSFFMLETICSEQQQHNTGHHFRFAQFIFFGSFS